MGSSRIRSIVSFSSTLVVVWACGGTATDPAPVGTDTARLSFPQGDNLGFCGSNPSPECAQGTPLAPKQLVFTFDDGPGSQTAAFADWLASQGIPATFFTLGEYVSDTSVLAREEADGHLVGNHTWDHQDLTTLSDSQILNEVSETDGVIAPYVASSHFVFRAPYGNWDSEDYNVLQGSPMSKYAGPVRWDIGGEMTDLYAADWDCWQNQSGYGVMTSKECGDRYLRQIADVGRGIVLMHDQDYGDVNNHDINNGQGNTIDMVKYMVPILKQEGYSWIRVDQVPDIAAQFGGGGGGTCSFDPTWQQGNANEWWIEYAISGSVTAASLEVVGGPTTTLSNMYGKWVGGPNAQIPSGTSVIVHATDSSNDAAQTSAFPYLVTTNPTTDCSGGGGGTDGGTDGGGTTDAGDDSSTDAGDAGACSPLNPTWTQGSGANNWWVEYAIDASTTIASAYLQVVGGETVTLSSMYGKWVGGPNARIATGKKVFVHATDVDGNVAQTKQFGYLNVTSPTTKPCP
ncbi:MAG TPA: polysaccharide deacetylase family protein [Polyangiaceae bacterium]|jgi:peptidoglycan/xylan/chitin deacetylase (PgdA/CDA1 family)